MIAPHARFPRTSLAAALTAALLAAACQAATPSIAPTTLATTPTTSTAGTNATPTPFLTPSISPDGTAAAASPAPRLAHLSVTLEPFANVPGGPLAMAAPDDGTGRLFVASKNGKIWVVQKDGSVLTEPMLDIGNLISNGGEQGLLGIATHPTFSTDPRVFISYTDLEGDSIVASAALDPGDANLLDPATLTKLLFVDQPYANHNGGGVQFGPDGKLYLSFGDGGSGGDPKGNGQNLQQLLGKILRIDIDGAPAAGPYVIPPDNPYATAGDTALPEIWHWGLRNPWRMSFDRANGDLWIGDVGENAYEEIDVARQGTRNLNFGWNVMEGSHCYGNKACSSQGLTLPVSDYGRDLGCTVIGGYVYRGAKYAFLAGTYLFADYCTGVILALDAASNGVVPAVVVGSVKGAKIVAFGQDPDGELYVTDLGGQVSRLVATQR